MRITIAGATFAILVAGHLVAAEPETAPAQGDTNAFPVTVVVDASKPIGELKPIWRMFGADELNYAYMKDGQKLLGELGALRPKGIYFRAHNLLCSGDGTPALKWGSTGVYREDAAGKPVYNWTILDRIFDTYRDQGVRPFVQIGFMPEAMSIIGESDPEGCAACQGKQLGYRNGTMYSSYTAASFARKWELARRHGVNLDAALTWAFTFEEQPLFAGFRQLASGGIDLPVLNVFRMFSLMKGQQLTVTSAHAVALDEIKRSGVRRQPDVSAIAPPVRWDTSPGQVPP